MLRTCQHCGKGFKAKPSEVRRGFGRYCSRSCAGHYKTKPPQKGELNHNWKGGRIRHIKGYVMIHCPDHYRADARGYVMEHIVVMEQKLGRLLWPWEVVHHINGKKDDNRPENLTVFNSTGEHTKYHQKLRRENNELRQIQ